MLNVVYVNLYMETIDVKGLSRKLLSSEDFILLDVRTTQEVFVSSINGSIHIPMNDIPARMNELDKDKEIIVQCKSGKRSAKVCEFLINNEFKNVKNLEGGIIAWSEQVDSSVLIY